MRGDLAERQQMRYAVRFEMLQLFVRVLRPNLVLAEGDFQLEIDVEIHVHSMHVRFSNIFEKRSNQWLIIHSHYSRPDAMLEEGGTLMDALQARNTELEKEVAQRTAALNQSLEDLKAAQAQLVQQEKMASLGTLTAGIAHEIKNPLNFINNFATLSRELADELEEETDPEEIQAILADLKMNAEKIEAHGRRADDIVRSMLEHSRGSSSERRAIDLNALVAEYVDLGLHSKRAQTVDFNVEITKDLDAAVGQVEVVPQEIGRALLNLLDNAFDAVCERAVEEDGLYAPMVAVTTRRATGQIEIRVSDNGPGIPENVEARIFEPFLPSVSRLRLVSRRSLPAAGRGLASA